MSSSFYSGSGLTNNEQDAIEGAKNAAEAARDAAQEAQAAAETAETNAEAAAASVTTGAATATTKASEASDSADTASTKADEAAASASAASTSASAASTSASAASTSASAASDSASAASTDADDAASAKTAAEAAQAAAEAALADFEGVYLGAHASDPTVDANGDAVNEGDLYFNTTDNGLLVYNGTAWVTSGITTVATSTDDGLMSSSDKSKLDAINQELSTTSSPTFDGSNITNVAAASVSVSESSDNNVDYNVLFSDTDGSGDIQMTPIQDDGGLYFNPFYNKLSTGNIYLSGGSTGSYITFEGLSSNNFETTLKVANPTADRNILLPDAGGTLALNDVATTSDDGLMSSSDKSKLDGIETGADVTDAANVEPLVDSHLNTSTAATGEYLKWDGTDYDWASVPPGYTDSDVDTHLNTSGASNGQYLEWNGTDYQWTTVDITVATTSDNGLMSSTDKSKLDGVEANATADQTASEIKTAYESNSDTNAFTDADHSKLDGIEASADVTDTANVTAAGALMDSELTSEASVKAIDQGLATTDSPTFAGLTSNGDIVFEGATDNDFETTVTVTDPTADRTITLPDASGTTVLRDSTTGDVSIGGNEPTFTLENGIGNYGSFKIEPSSVTSAWQIKGNEDSNGLINGFDLVGGGNYLATLRTSAQGGLTFWQPVKLANAVDITFEGATSDAYQTTLTVEDPTADQTITLPDQTGTAMLWQSKWPDDPAQHNYAFGYQALNTLTSGSYNLAIGSFALRYQNGSNCIGIGYSAGSSMTSGNWNTLVGTNSGSYLTTEENCTLIGYRSGADSTGSDGLTAVGSTAAQYTTGDYVTAIGRDVLSAANNTGGYNTAVGYRSLDSDTTGGFNTAVGAYSGYGITTGEHNTSFGSQSGQSITTGDYNTAIGSTAMMDNATDNHSTAVGYAAGRGAYLTGGTYVGSLAGNYNSSSKDYQTAIGYGAQNDNYGDYATSVGHNSMTDGYHYQSTAMGTYALSRSTTWYPYYNVAIGYSSGSQIYGGDQNVLIGNQADVLDSNGSNNVVIGYQAKGTSYVVAVGHSAHLSANSTSQYNVCVGNHAGYDMDGGDFCTFVGHEAGYNGGTANYNSGFGRRALYNLTTGEHNSSVGNVSLYNLTTGSSNIAMGTAAGYSITSGSNNTMLGHQAGYSQNNSQTNALTTGSNVMCLGNQSMPSSPTATNEITLGDDDITSLRCNVQTISSLSDERDKTAIEDLPYGLDFINDMRPVKFTWNRRDGSYGAKPDMGFIAQELREVEMDHGSGSRTRLVNDNNPSKLEADYVRSYPILVKAVQELSAKCDALEARLAQLEGA